MNFDLKTGLPLSEANEREMHNIKVEFEKVPPFAWRTDPIPGGLEIVYLLHNGSFCHSEITPGEPWPFEQAARSVNRATMGYMPLGWLPRDYTGTRIPESEEPIMRQSFGEYKCRLDVQNDNNGDVYFSLYARDSEHGESFIEASTSLKNSHFDDHDLYEYGIYLKSRARKERML